jgi:hypothetical protein
MRSKNLLLSSSALILTALWVPQVQAIPAFARQMGMACTACHYQHFPVLNAFGRAFKEGGFTMMGSEEKIENDNPSLSLPANLNAAIEVYAQYLKTNGPTNYQTATTKDSNNGALDIPASASVFYGGRVARNVGFEAELNIYPTPAGLLNYKLPVVTDVGAAKVGAVLYSTAVYGPSFGLEVLDTGANGVHLFNQYDQAAISAQQYINTGLPASGIDLIASNDMGFVVLGKWLPDQTSGSGNPTSNYVRVAATPGDLIPGFDFGVGFQVWSGSGASTGDLPGTVGSGAAAGFNDNPFGATPAVVNGTFDTRASAVDAQLLGDVGGLPLTLIASYARAPSSGASTGTVDGFQGNIFNPGTATRKSFNVGAELGVIPQKLTVQAGLRRASSGFAIPGAGVTNATDNALLLGLTYALDLNVRTDITFSKYSGDMYDAASQTLQGNAYLGDSMLNLTLVAAF